MTLLVSIYSTVLFLYSQRSFVFVVGGRGSLLRPSYNPIGLLLNLMWTLCSLYLSTIHQYVCMRCTDVILWYTFVKKKYWKTHKYKTWQRKSLQWKAAWTNSNNYAFQFHHWITKNIDALAILWKLRLNHNNYDLLDRNFILFMRSIN